VFLAGEGPNDLGGWARHPSYRDPHAPGVVESLLRKIDPDAWEIVDAMPWKRFRKLQVSRHGRAEERNIRAMILHARERACDTVVFTRDRDGDADRQMQIERAVIAVEGEVGCPEIVGGVAVERLESWLVALSGRTGSEAMRDAQVDEILAQLEVPPKDTRAMVALVDRTDLARIPDDAASLTRWMARAREVASHVGT
jgi:hypothetical protein